MTSDTIESISVPISTPPLPPLNPLTTLSSITTLRLSGVSSYAPRQTTTRELNEPTEATITWPVTGTPLTSASSSSSSTTTSSGSYHLQYEKKQKNVSRLLTKFITPSPLEMTSTTTMVEQIAITSPSSGSVTAATIVTARTPVAAVKGPTIIYPTGAPRLQVSFSSYSPLLLLVFSNIVWELITLWVSFSRKSVTQSPS